MQIKYIMSHFPGGTCLQQFQPIRVNLNMILLSNAAVAYDSYKTRQRYLSHIQIFLTNLLKNKVGVPKLLTRLGV